MRPVQRGAAPASPFTEYRQAFKPLRDRLGAYCSFCEREIPTHLAVEHVQSKAKHPNLELVWENFLLACGNCNSTKNDRNDTRAGYLWPDENNTQLAFSYANGIVRNVLAPAHPAHNLANALMNSPASIKTPVWLIANQAMPTVVGCFGKKPGTWHNAIRKGWKRVTAQTCAQPSLSLRRAKVVSVFGLKFFKMMPTCGNACWQPSPAMQKIVLTAVRSRFPNPAG